jgi:hypothetical protein
MKRPSFALNQENRLDSREFKVIGLGGIGAPLALALAQFLSSGRPPRTLWLVDGDAYEERNRERMFFASYENKALAKVCELSTAFGASVTLLPVPEYVTPRNAGRIIKEDDVIFLCVDNHATRKLVSQRCRRLKNVALFTGGNDGIENGQSGTFGNVQIYLRQNGRDQTNRLTRFHPEIAHPGDRRPDEMGCAALAGSAPQLVFTNLSVASAILGAFYSWLSGRLDFEEIYLDIALGRMTPVKRVCGHEKS